MILIAEREYEGQDWFCFLAQEQIVFIIRLKAKSYRKIVDQARGCLFQATQTSQEKKTKIHISLEMYSTMFIRNAVRLLFDQ